MSRFWSRSSGWVLLLAIGQIATLTMVRAGPGVGYQHFVAPWELFAEVPIWAIAAFAVEVLLVGLGLTAHLSTIRSFIRERGVWRTAVVAALFVMTSATLSLSVPRYLSELLFAATVQLVHLGAVFLFAVSLSEDAVSRVAFWIERVLGPAPQTDEAEPGGSDRFVWVLAACVAVTAALLAIFVYQRHPHVPDEVSYLLQARYFAAGQLTMPLPKVPLAFNVDLMTYQSTRWFSPFPPGWPMLLAVGAAVGLPWLVNPLLGGIAVVLAYVFLREIYPRRTARLATLLLAASPWALLMAMNLMSHTASLVAALIAAAAVARLRRDPRGRWAVMAGVAIGVVGLIRPLEGVALALLLGFWSLGARGRRVRLWPSVVLTVTTMATSALTLPYNRVLTGHADRFPVMEYMNATFGPGSNDLGFGANRGSGWRGLDPLPGHGPLDVLINANFNFFQTNTELLGWATGSLLLIAMLLAWGKLRRADWTMVAAVATIVGIHSFYYFSGGPDFGARYWYLIIVPCLALSARGLESLGWQAASGSSRSAPTRVIAGALALTLVSLVVFVPWRATDKYFHYRGMRPGVRDLADDPAFRNGMLLIRGNRHPDFASAVVYNALDLDSPAPVFVRDIDAATRRALVEAYPERSFWLVDGPTVTGDGYRIVAGPLRGAELVARPDAPHAPQ